MEKKIAFFLPNDNLGGAEQYLKNIAEYYVNNGYSIDVFFLKQKDSESWECDDKFNLYYTNSKKELKGIFGLINNLLKYRQKKYDYVYTSHIHLNAFTNLLRVSKMIISDYHIARESTSIFTRYKGKKLLIYKFLYSYCYSNIDLLICQSSFMKKQLIDNMTKFKKKDNIVVIPNLFNYSLIKNKIIKDSELNFPYIVSAGRLINEKGFDILITAFKRISINSPDLKLVILGEGNLRKELQEKISNLELYDKVILKGFVKDVYPYFKFAKVCVVSSRIEGFPNVLLQMMSQNQKVVSTLCAGGIENLKGVVTCPTNSEEELSEAIEFCLKNELNTREIFDKELESRSINNFVKTINNYLNAN